MNILVDYLTISIRKMSLELLLEKLKLSTGEFESGYSRWLGHKLYLGGISIHYGEYIILEMSGHGIVGTAAVVSVQAACVLIASVGIIHCIVIVAPPVPKTTAK